MDALEQQVLQFMQQKFGGDPKRDLSLSSLGVDSLGMAELTLELEKAFSIRVDEGILDVETVGEMIDYVRQRQLSATAS